MRNSPEKKEEQVEVIWMEQCECCETITVITAGKNSSRRSGLCGHCRGKEDKEDLRFLYQGSFIDVDAARVVIAHWRRRECWDEEDVWAVWARLLDDKEEYDERIQCAELIEILTHDELEILVGASTEERQVSVGA